MLRAAVRRLAPQLARAAPALEAAAARRGSAAQLAHEVRLGSCARSRLRRRRCVRRTRKRGPTLSLGPPLRLLARASARLALRRRAVARHVAPCACGGRCRAAGARGCSPGPFCSQAFASARDFRATPTAAAGAHGAGSKHDFEHATGLELKARARPAAALHHTFPCSLGANFAPRTLTPPLRHAGAGSRGGGRPAVRARPEVAQRGACLTLETRSTAPLANTLQRTDAPSLRSSRWARWRTR